MAAAGTGGRRARGRTLLLLLAAVLALGPLLPGPLEAKVIFRLRNRREVSLAAMVADLRRARVVFVGERHDRAEDHVAQRTIIQALHDAGAKVAVGLEMFRAADQPALDRWVARGMAAEELRRVFEGSWTPGSWPLYDELLIYARQERIPLVGLNVPAEIPATVARGGFAALSPAHRSAIGVTACDVPDRYRDVLRRVLGEKGRSPQGFDRFCQAQLVWDEAMARTLAAYAVRNPERTVVVLAGTFHAWRHGIPLQLARIAPGLAVRIILPSSDRTAVDYEVALADADYVWWQQ